MLTLGIETSCDETSISLTDGNNVLSNAVSSSVHLHKKYGGVVPEIASRCHVEYIVEVLENALSDAKAELDDVELIAVTNGPGLVGALLTGISLAKSLSLSLKVPLVGVNHILAHLYSSFLSAGRESPKFPFVGLVVSGGHTALFHCKSIGRQKILGMTQDDAVGEAYDKVAKILGLGYPGGPVIDKRAKLSGAHANIRFPKSMMQEGSFDFSFSGIKTAVLYYANSLRQKNGHISQEMINDICYAFQEAALDVLVEKTARAVEATGSKSVIIGGGVAANSRLRQKMAGLCSLYSVKAYFPEMKYCMDNAAMIGYLGEALYHKGLRSDLYLSAEPNLAVS